MAVRTLERNLNHASPNEETCKHLQAAFASVGSTNLLPFALIGERATLIPVFRMSWKEIKGFSEETSEKPRRRQKYSGKPVKLFWLVGFFERDLNFFLKTMQESIARAALPAPNLVSLTNYFESAEKVASKEVHFYSAMLLPALERTVVREASTLAHIELAQTALALERFRSAHGQPPRTLKNSRRNFSMRSPSTRLMGLLCVTGGWNVDISYTVSMLTVGMTAGGEARNGKSRVILARTT